MLFQLETNDKSKRGYVSKASSQRNCSQYLPWHPTIVFAYPRIVLGSVLFLDGLVSFFVLYVS
jgi:hypothetical protein